MRAPHRRCAKRATPAHQVHQWFSCKVLVGVPAMGRWDLCKQGLHVIRPIHGRAREAPWTCPQDAEAGELVAHAKVVALP